MSAIQKVMKAVDPNCSKKILSIVVLSSNNVIIESISEALLDVHAMGNFRWKLVVLRSSSVEDIERTSDLTGAIYKDFVIIAVDTSKMFCLNWANTVLEQVQPHLRLRRVVFVNATNCPAHAMAVSASDLITFCSENRLELLNADVSKQEDAKFLAHRLLKYLEVSIGVNTGIPNINI